MGKGRQHRALREGPPPDIRHEFTHVDVAGNAAVVRLELYRFPNGWKIVSKIFHAQPVG